MQNLSVRRYRPLALFAGSRLTAAEPEVGALRLRSIAARCNVSAKIRLLFLSRLLPENLTGFLGRYANAATRSTLRGDFRADFYEFINELGKSREPRGQRDVALSQMAFL